MKLFVPKFFLFTSLFIINACGGGSSSDSGAIMTNTAPYFINNIGEVEINELQTGVATIEANDLDGDLLQYSLSGNDPSYFAISNQGVITFNQAPDYNVKNEFSIVIDVTDNVVSISQSLTVYLLRVCNEDLLGFKVCFEDENLAAEYNRDRDYPTWEDWDNDCQNNRHEVLISEHIDDDQNHPLVLSSNGCYVDSGKWFDPYDSIYYFNSSEVQIDHVVALFEAHKSGAWSFPDKRKLRFANNIDFDDLLIAVGGSSNSKKGSSDPASWMPSNISYACDYLNKWLNIKSEFRLSVDEDERASIAELYEAYSCSN